MSIYFLCNKMSSLGTHPGSSFNCSRNGMREFRREYFGTADVFLPFFRDEFYMDAKVASQQEPHLVLKGHRLLLAACSKVLHKKFQREPDPNTVIKVDLVDHKNLNYTFQLIYEGRVTVTHAEADSLLATLRALSVHLGGQFDRMVYMDDDLTSTIREDYDPNMSTTVASPVSSTSSLEKKMLNDISDHKPDVKSLFDADKLLSNNPDLVLAESSEKPELKRGAFSGTSSSSQLPFKKLKVVPPPRQTRQTATPQRGPEDLFWIEFKNEEGLVKETLASTFARWKLKKVRVDNSGFVYLAMETFEMARRCLEQQAITNPGRKMKPVNQLPIERLLPDNAEPSVPENGIFQVHLKNFAMSWNLAMFTRFFRKNKFPVQNDQVKIVNKGEVIVTLRTEEEVKKFVNFFNEKTIAESRFPLSAKPL